MRQKKIKILIVDDDPLMHLLYKRHLERQGFEVLAAQNGEEALRVVAQSRPDLILMDVMMPEKDGLAAVRELKQNEVMREVPVIVMTADAEQYQAVGKEARIAGAEGFLTKPVSPARLISEVRRFFPRG
jgi:CheY-like chemotaxis protein